MYNYFERNKPTGVRSTLGT